MLKLIFFQLSFSVRVINIMTVRISGIIWIIIIVFNICFAQRARQNQESCGIAKNDAESNNIYQGQWPFIAAIYHSVNGQLNFICGGTIISKVFVVSGEIQLHLQLD